MQYEYSIFYSVMLHRCRSSVEHAYGLKRRQDKKYDVSDLAMNSAVVYKSH